MRASVGGAPEQLATDTAVCNRPSSGTVACPLAKPIGGLALAFGGDGNDTITLSNRFDNGTTADFDGGDDNDSLTGSNGSEVLFSGNTGADALNGGDGPDALLALGRGGDTLDAGPGNDQLVTNDPCQRHVFIGGRDQDVAGFARTNPAQSVNGNWGINAYLGDPNGNPANLGGNWYGHARLLDRGGTGNACAGGAFTYVGADNEILEGTLKQDVLIGNDVANTLWGRPEATTTSSATAATTSCAATTGPTTCAATSAEIASRAATASTTCRPRRLGGRRARLRQRPERRRGRLAGLDRSGGDELLGRTRPTTGWTCARTNARATRGSRTRPTAPCDRPARG